MLPLVAMTSLAALKTAGAPWHSGPGPRPTVMVLGGSGGCGSSGIQMAKAFGAGEIWTTTSADNFAYVKTLGATKVLA